MIKLEELKPGDKIYGACSDGTGMYAETVVYQKLAMIDTYPTPTEAVWCTGGIELLTRNYEDYFFRTEQEAIDKLMELRVQVAKEIIKNGKFVERLFECATSSKRLSKYGELPIYEIALELYKESL
jgi:hypothetical protein